MMKKEYITPEMLIRRVILESFIADSEILDNNPYPSGDDWGEDQGAKGNGESWHDKGDNIWED